MGEVLEAPQKSTETTETETLRQVIIPSKKQINNYVRHY